MPQFSDLPQRLSGLAGEKWALHSQARALIEQGLDIIELTIGEPDIPPTPALIEAAKIALDQRRTRYSNGQGEAGLLAALAQHYTQRLGGHGSVTADNFIAWPGTQTALYGVLQTLVGPGQRVMVGDPLYATYESVIAAAGASPRFVPLSAAQGFRYDVAAFEAAWTPDCKAVLLNTPHNPTGAVTLQPQLEEVLAFARHRDLWVISDEVYADLIFDPARHPACCLWGLAGAAERCVITSSISKSHAAPGFRSGWSLSSPAVVQAMLPLAEAMLFGNQPFLADATAAVLNQAPETAQAMAQAYARRAQLVHDRLQGHHGVRVLPPQAGMFILVDVSASGLDGEAFAQRLLHDHRVAVMPGASFGRQLQGWIRLSLTLPDRDIATACQRILACMESLDTADTA